MYEQYSGAIRDSGWSYLGNCRNNRGLDMKKINWLALILAAWVGLNLGYVWGLHRRPNTLHQLRPCTDIIRYNDGRLVCEIDIQAEDDTI